MGITERREREKNERRRMILEGTRELILEKGVDRVNMEDIADKVELSKATLYLYFQGKEFIYNEICEEAACSFLELAKPIIDSGLNGIDTIKKIWQGYMELFGKSNEMIIVFKVRNYLNPGQPFFSLGEYGESTNVLGVFEILKSVIKKCIDDGIFDSSLDPDMATSLLLLQFSNYVDRAARLSIEERKSPHLVKNMTDAFKIMIRGFAKDGIDRSLLDIIK